MRISASEASAHDWGSRVEMNENGCEEITSIKPKGARYLPECIKEMAINPWHIDSFNIFMQPNELLLKWLKRSAVILRCGWYSEVWSCLLWMWMKLCDHLLVTAGHKTYAEPWLGIKSKSWASVVLVLVYNELQQADCWQRQKERKVRRVELIVRVTKKLSLDLELVLHNNPAAGCFSYIVQ